jgi:uncharacterized phosphatase
MTTICLVRHGETDWNRAGRLQGREDTPLNENGRQQAAVVATFLAQNRWDRIVSSPLARAQETAGIIGRKTGVSRVEVEENFTERDFGRASGLLKDEIAASFPDGNIPGREDWDELCARAMNAMERWARGYPDGRLIIVAHGGIINAIIHRVSGGTAGTGKTILKNGCLSQLRYKNNLWELDFFNITIGDGAGEEQDNGTTAILQKLADH